MCFYALSIIYHLVLITLCSCKVVNETSLKRVVLFPNEPTNIVSNLDITLYLLYIFQFIHILFMIPCGIKVI